MHDSEISKNIGSLAPRAWPIKGATMVLKSCFMVFNNALSAALRFSTVGNRSFFAVFRASLTSLSIIANDLIECGLPSNIYIPTRPCGVRLPKCIA